MSDHDHRSRLEDLFVTRRQFIRRCGMGMGVVGLGGLMGTEGLLGSIARAASDPAAAPAWQTDPLAVKAPHFAAKAKHVIHIFANGGPSHVDTFDPKPKLDEFAGRQLPFDNPRTERKTGAAFPSPFKFAKHGQSGLEISDIFPHVAKSADELCVIRSMHADVPNHEPSLLLMNCGEARLVRPSFGSWVTYGLGSENRNLPGFVVLCPGGMPIQESQNWQSAFLPGVYQGTHVDNRNTEVDKLVENVRNPRMSLPAQRRQIDLLQELNARHRKEREYDAAIEARIQSYELAYRMQIEASEVFDVTKEPAETRELYGDTLHGRQMLIARRLVERGVRFVQAWHGAGQPWDSHDDLETIHRKLAGECDQAIGALLLDLKRMGLLEETLVLWGGEFGRTPTVELPQAGANAGKINGRDHNNHGFSVWLAGGGVKPGIAYGATDEFGFAAVENKVHVHDLHATMLHLLGFDHEKLTYRHAGRDFRLTDVKGRVVTDLIG